MLRNQFADVLPGPFYETSLNNRHAHYECAGRVFIYQVGRKQISSICQRRNQISTLYLSNLEKHPRTHVRLTAVAAGVVLAGPCLAGEIEATAQLPESDFDAVPIGNKKLFLIARMKALLKVEGGQLKHIRTPPAA